LAWPRWKMRILFRPNSAFGSRKARTDRVFGREVVAALVEWGHATLGKGSFIYPVAIQNIASRRIAENLHGEIIGNRTNPKYDSVVYRIPFYESPYSQFS
jgi:RimJ/RimL family protein N-acetyltransferase